MTTIGLFFRRPAVRVDETYYLIDLVGAEGTVADEVSVWHSPLASPGGVWTLQKLARLGSPTPARARRRSLSWTVPIRK